MFRETPEDVIFTLTREDKAGFENSRVNEGLLKEKVKDFSRNFYLCGPLKFTVEIKKVLEGLGASVDAIVFEGRG